MKKSVFSIILFILSFAFLYGGEPLNTLKSEMNQINALISSGASESEIKSKFSEIVDYDTMAEEVTGMFCSKLTEAQCIEFKQVFSEMLENSLLNQITRYADKKINFVSDEIQNNTAIVKSEIDYNGDIIQINYEMKEIGGNWKIVNFIIDNVDTVRNYQKQFTRLFKRSEYDNIINRLKKKLNNYN